MAYTETSYTGYGTRVKNSFKAIGTGFVLFLGGTALLWWNEGRAVKVTFEKIIPAKGEMYYVLNKFFAWYYFKMKKPGAYVRSMATRELNKKLIV